MTDPWSTMLPCSCRIEDGLVHELCPDHEVELSPPWQLRKVLDDELDAVVNGRPVRFDKNRIRTPALTFTVRR